MVSILNKKVNPKRPRIVLTFFQLLALFLLFVYGEAEPDKSTLVAGLILVFMIYISNIILSKVSTGDNYIFLVVTMLLSIGIMMIYRIKPNLGARQVVWIGLGIIIFFMTYFVVKNLKFLDKLLPFYVGSSIILFVITLLFADRTKGALNWITMFGIRFQPTELIKILMIFMIASYYSNYEKYKKKKYGSYYLMAIIYVFIAFLFLQKDLGTVLIFYAIFLALQFIYEENRKLIYINIVLFIASGVAGLMLFNHVQIRFETWLHPWKYVNDKGYQITQSLFAIATGGFFGTGIGLGHPEFIPEVHTDFIFSAICEEMGIFTGMGIIMLFLLLVYRGFKIGINQQNKFFRIVALGISILFGIQAFIIFGGVMKMIPLTGITIPFVSYGGSSMISSFICLGILQVASEELHFEEAKDGEGN